MDSWECTYGIGDALLSDPHPVSQNLYFLLVFDFPFIHSLTHITYWNNVPCTSPLSSICNQRYCTWTLAAESWAIFYHVHLTWRILYCIHSLHCVYFCSLLLYIGHCNNFCQQGQRPSHSRTNKWIECTNNWRKFVVSYLKTSINF